MLRRTLVTAVVLPVLACDADSGLSDATDRASQLETLESRPPRPVGPPTAFGVMAAAATEVASLDDEQREELNLVIDELGQAQQQLVQAKESVNAALAAGVEACDFGGDGVVAATGAAAATAEAVGAAEVDALDALHDLLYPTQRMLVVRKALERLQGPRPPSRSFVRVLARFVELSDDQIVAAADALADQESLSEDDLLPADLTDLIEAFSAESFDAAGFDVELQTLAHTEARGAWLISSLDAFCPVLDPDQREALADALVEPFSSPGAPGCGGAKPR